MVFSASYRYRFGDIDHAGIAYYPRILHLVHCAFEDWWADGLAKTYPALMAEERLGFPAVHLDVDFLRPIRYGDEVLAEVVVLKVGNASATFGFRLLDARAEEDEVVFARIRKVTVAVDMDSLEKRSIPDKWRAAFEAHSVDAASWA
jgi:4-hydroxybenzoyl-CoA thioesterase